MKKIALALLALLVAAPALAGPAQFGGLARWQQTRPPLPNAATKARSVVIVYDREFKDSNWGNGQVMEQDLTASVGKLAEVLRAQGALVTQMDYYALADSNAMVPLSVAVGQNVTGAGGAPTVAYISPSRDYFSLTTAATSNNQAATLTIGGVASGPWKIVSGRTEVRLMLGSNEMFRTLGDYYSSAVMVGFRALFRANATHEKKFFCAESTNVQMIHVGGKANYASYDDGSSPLYGSADTTRSSDDDESIAAGRSVAPYDGKGGLGDTLWMDRCMYGVRPVSLPAGCTVVRLFHPVMNTLKGAASDSSLFWGAGADSSRYTNAAATYGSGVPMYRYRSGWWAVSRDSVARQPYEPLPLAWRVYWTDTNGDGKDHVDFVKAVSSVNTRFIFGDIAYSLVARYTKLSPIKIAMEWDDMANYTPTDGIVGAGTYSPQYARIDGDELGDLVDEMRNVWGMRLATNIAPDSIIAYARGTPAGQWEGSAVKRVKPHSYYFEKKLPWIYHAHDSSSFVGSNFVGKFGGYYPANGQNVIIGAYDVSAFTHRNLAGAFDPNNLLAANDPNKYGIFQRLLRSDSLRRVYCPSCPLPPYFSFPNNDMIPLDWKQRPGGGHAPMVGNGSISMDNYFTAMGQATKAFPYSGGTLYVRGYFHILNSIKWKDVQARNKAHSLGGVMYPQFSVVNRYREFDRDSLAAEMFFLDPDVRMNYGSSAGGGFRRVVQNIGTINLAAQSDILSEWAGSQRIRNQLLGFCNPQQRAGGPASDYGEAFSADPNGIISGNTNIIRNGAGRVRIVYCHPLFNTTGPGGKGEIEAQRTVILRPLRALNRIAGHPIHQWVYPWETVQ